MDFPSKPSNAKGIAIFLGAVAFCMAYFALFVASGVAAVVLFIVTLVFAVASFLASTAGYTVTLDRETGVVEKCFECKFYRHVRRFHLGNYSSVGIGVGGRSGNEYLSAAYFVQLLGDRNLNLLPADSDIEAVRRSAHTVSEYLNFPLDDNPRSVAFGKRL